MENNVFGQLEIVIFWSICKCDFSSDPKLEIDFCQHTWILLHKLQMYMLSITKKLKMLKSLWSRHNFCWSTRNFGPSEWHHLNRCTKHHKNTPIFFVLSNSKEWLCLTNKNWEPSWELLYGQLAFGRILK